MSQPQRATIPTENAAGSPSGETGSRETSPNPDLPSPHVEALPSQVQAEPRTGRNYKRRLTFDHPLQYRMLSIILSYSLIAAVLLAIPVFTPMMQSLDNPSLSWQEKAVAANDLLDLHERYWPWALGAVIILLIHCLHAMRLVNHVAGPLKRLETVFRQISQGNLSIITTLRHGDALTHEAELVNQMTAQLQTRISAIKTAQVTVSLDVDRLKQAVATGGDPTIAELVKKMEHNLADLKASLDFFRTHKR